MRQNYWLQSIVQDIVMASGIVRFRDSVFVTKQEELPNTT